MKKIISLSLVVLGCSNIKAVNDKLLGYELSTPYRESSLLDEVLTPNTVKDLCNAFANADQAIPEFVDQNIVDNHVVELTTMDPENINQNQNVKEEKYITLRNRIVVFRNIVKSNYKKVKRDAEN